MNSYDRSDLVILQPEQPATHGIILAHGAGAGAQHTFMQQLASCLVNEGFAVVLFDFPYMRVALDTGKKRPPNKMPMLEAAFLDVATLAFEHLQLPLIFAGKSMGSRVALACLPQALEKGLTVCATCAYGFPFHPVGKPDRLRIDAFIPTSPVLPVFIIQGTRDSFGKREEVNQYALPEHVECWWVEGGDHSLTPLKASGKRHETCIEEAAQATRSLIQAHKL